MQCAKLGGYFTLSNHKGQDNNKLSYALGNFTPTIETAEALITYAELHAESSNGQVPYKSWPEKIKGHFVARIPPLMND